MISDEVIFIDKSHKRGLHCIIRDNLGKGRRFVIGQAFSELEKRIDPWTGCKGGLKECVNILRC